jgi:Rhodopirellula transposase DDE domain
LAELVADATAGDPITGLKWTRKTLRKLSRELKRRGFLVSPPTVRRLLQAQDYTLRVNRKRLSKQANPHRDQQMRYIARQRRTFLRKGAPVISVDTKKKELVGPFRNAGRTWRQHPLAVLATDFPGDADGKAIPYGIYDLHRNAGYLVVGTSHETAPFAVAAIRTWWWRVGRHHYAAQPHLLIEADGGGANSCRSWLWKTRLQALADEFQLTITVTHLPPGASKWNPIEHRLFSAITQNWAGQPLSSYETILQFIRTTTTARGLRCRACLDPRDYPTGLKVTAQEKAQVNLVPRQLFPHWNYTIRPHKAGPK